MNRVARSDLRAMARLADARRGLLIATIALGGGAVLAGVGLLTTSGYLVSRAAQRPEILSLGVAIVGVRFFGIVRALLRYGERLVSHELAFRTLGTLRTTFFSALIPRIPGTFPGGKRAELLSRFVADVDRMQDLYLRALAPPAIALLSGSAAIVIAALIDPAASLVLAAGLLIAATAVPAATRAAARNSGARQGPARAALSSSIAEIVEGAPEIALAGREEQWLKRAARESDRLVQVQRGDALAGGLGAGLMTGIAAITTVGVAATAAADSASGGLAGVLVAAVTLLSLAAFEAVSPLAAAASSIDACAGAARRISQITSAPVPIADAAVTEAAPSVGALHFDKVLFAYRGCPNPVLRSVDLELEPGRAVALIGSSGCGKTTLAELAVRFAQPSSGVVRIGSTDVSTIAQDELRETVRLCSQDSYVFGVSIRENLKLGRADAGEAEMRESLELVGLGGWIATLPEGLDTLLGERGATISGGQRQRVAAARALLGGPRFLIFDEPTAHLDATSSVALLGVLARVAQRRGVGVLVITHETAGLDPFDEILELRGGRLVHEPRPAGPPHAPTDDSWPARMPGDVAALSVER